MSDLSVNEADPVVLLKECVEKINWDIDSLSLKFNWKKIIL